MSRLASVVLMRAMCLISVALCVSDEYCKISNITKKSVWNCDVALQSNKEKTDFEITSKSPNRKHRNTTEITSNATTEFKYVLFWPLVHWNALIRDIVAMQTMFGTRKYPCAFNNCIFHMSFNNITKYDAIIFPLHFVHAPHTTPALNISRSFTQKYVYLFMESTNNYPVRDRMFNLFFNWTMSYRLSSDIKLPYLYIYDKHGKIVGPKINMTWEKHMKPLNNGVRNKLKTKTKLAAMFVSNCGTASRRMELVAKLNISLSKYGKSVDVFGSCGTRNCSRNNLKQCRLMLKRDYFFYLAFENSFSLDYVTEKLLHAVQTYTVPVVYGGADYERFLPPGSYINACSLDPDQLAHKMVTVMSNWTEFFDYLRFYNHYTYVDAHTDMTFVCDLCTSLNNETLMKSRSSYRNFYTWHDVDTRMGCQRDEERDSKFRDPIKM